MMNSWMLAIFRWFGHQHWLRQGIRYRIISLFYSPDKKTDYPFVVDFYGLRYAGNFTNYIDWMTFFYGAYERQYGLFMRKVLAQNKEPVFIDIGANIGQHSLMLATVCKEIHAFEPYDVVREKFNHQIERNQIKNIEVHAIGLGDQNEEVTFYEPTGTNQGMGSFLSDHSDTNKQYKKLPIRRADEYFETHAINKVDLIKIDVEGLEDKVLKGMPRILSQYRPIVCMEYSLSTAKQVDSLPALLALFPEGYLVKTFETIGTKAYKLMDFDVKKGHQDVVFYPQERTLV